MSVATSPPSDDRFSANAMASFIRIGAVLLLLISCYRIVSPFVYIVAWALIIGIAVHPLHARLTARFGGREKLSSVLLVVIGLAIIIIPTWILAESSIVGLRNAATALESGQVTIAPPNDSVADWPLIGGPVHEFWSEAAANLESTLNKYNAQFRKAGQSLANFAGGTFLAVLQFVLATIIAGVLLLNADGGYRFTRNFAAKLAGPMYGDKLVDLSIMTIRSVVKGVLGVAVIQTVLSAGGLLAIGIPAAGLWAGAVLVLAIVQLPPILVLGPIAVWYYSVAAPVPATIFLVYAFVVSTSDAFLKPMLLGRGVSTPMLVILIGAIGGAMTQGIMGLFIGAVILAVGYEILIAWLAPDTQAAEPADAG